MKGKNSKMSVETQSTSSKPSNEESPVQVVPDDSPNQPKILDIPQNPDEECRVEVNESQNNSLVGQQDTPGHKDEKAPIMHQSTYLKSGLVPYKRTWFTNILEQSWREQRKKNNYGEGSGPITLQMLLF